MPDWDDPDLEPSPFTDPDARGRIRGVRRPRARYLPDLDAMNHRKRNALVDYAHAMRGRGSTSHAAVLERLSMTERDWRTCVEYATRRGIAAPVLEQPSETHRAWHCGSRACADCNRTEAGRRLHSTQHPNNGEK